MIHLGPSTPEQRRPLYEDVESLLIPGFLTHSVTVMGVHLCMRSLGPGDVYMLTARSQAPHTDWRAWAVASSVWMVNGYNLLSEPNVVPRLYKFIRSMPKQSRDLLVSVLTGLLHRQNRAVEATEAYCFEFFSRYRWKTLGSLSPANASGIPGAPFLGTNHVQRMWIAFNEVEDQRLAEYIEWEGVKLIAASWNPKGVQRLDQRDTQTREEEGERRQQVLDTFYYRTKGIDLPSGLRWNKRGDAVKMARTADELADEMRRWVAGEMDEHDQIVAEWKDQLMARREAEKQARMHHLEEIRRQRETEEGDAVSHSRPLVGLTAAEVSRALREGGYHPGMRTIHEGNVAERLYEKYVKAETVSGLININEEGRLDSPRVSLEGHTVRLQDQITQRSVPYRSGSDEGGR